MNKKNKMLSFIFAKIKSDQSFKRVFSFRKSGFSLIETLLSVFIFSLMVLMMSGAFSSFLKNYSEAKKMQRNVENAQFAMNLMAKTIRTSDVVLIDANSLGCFDYAQSKCVKYTYVSLTKSIQVSEGSATNLDGCNFSGMSYMQNITSSNIAGAYFSVTPSTSSSYGRVTAALSVSEAGQTAAPLAIQMTVSLRNYK